MTAQELIETKEVKWMIEHGKEMICENGTIPGSAIFTGKIPYRMIEAVANNFKANGAIAQDTGNGLLYSVSSGETESDFGVTFTADHHNRVKFILCPYQW